MNRFLVLLALFACTSAKASIQPQLPHLTLGNGVTCNISQDVPNGFHTLLDGVDVIELTVDDDVQIRLMNLDGRVFRNVAVSSEVWARQGVASLDGDDRILGLFFERGETPGSYQIRYQWDYHSADIRTVVLHHCLPI